MAAVKDNGAAIGGKRGHTINLYNAGWTPPRAIYFNSSASPSPLSEQV